MEAAIFVLNEEIKKIENNIDWLVNKNEGHQNIINGNNERIEELKEAIKEFLKAKELLTK